VCHAEKEDGRTGQPFIAQRIAEAEQQGFRFFGGKQQRLDL